MIEPRDFQDMLTKYEKQVRINEIKIMIDEVETHIRDIDNPWVKKPTNLSFVSLSRMKIAYREVVSDLNNRLKQIKGGD